MIRRRRLARTAALAVAVAAVAACTHSTTVRLTDAPPSGRASPPVRVLGVWSGPEYDSFASVKSAWEKRTGGVVDWQASQSLPDDLASALESSTPPDIAVLPNVAMLHELARAGKLVPLDSVLDGSAFERDYSPAWQELGSDQGRPYGIFYKVSSK